MRSETNNVGDLVSMGVLVGVAHNWLPAVASILATVWTCIRIYEWARWRLISRRRQPFE